MKTLIKKILGKKGLNFVKKSFLGRVDELDVILRFFNKIRSKGGVMVDVGVHYGESSTPFLQKGWKVYGFEPDNKNKAILLKNIPANSNFTLFECALSDQPGELNLYASDESSGISSLLNFHSTHEAVQVVKVETLNHMIEEHKLEPIDFLKIDAEGFDLLVLKGMDLHKYNSVEMVLCEYEDLKTQKLGYTVTDMIDYLTQFGYKVMVCEWEPIVKYGGNHKFRAAKMYPCELDPKAWGNLIAFKNPEFEKFGLKALN